MFITHTAPLSSITTKTLVVDEDEILKCYQILLYMKGFFVIYLALSLSNPATIVKPKLVMVINVLLL